MTDPTPAEVIALKAGDEPATYEQLQSAYEAMRDQCRAAHDGWAAERRQLWATRDALINLEAYLRNTPHHNAMEAAAARKAIDLPRPPAADAGEVRERIARIIAREWFGEIDGRHVLDNYPGQHKEYQAKAFAKADAILALFPSSPQLLGDR